MDPLSAIGLISGAFQVGQVISETLAGLASLREKYQHADLTIGTLEQQLRTIKAAITHLEVWTSARLREYPAEYSRSLEVALDGCRTVMEALSNEVHVLTQGASPNEVAVGFRTRIRVLWREDTMRGHQERLHSQVVALQLLVQACQCQSSAEQVELLRKAESRHIIRKVADDAATLRSSTGYAGSRADTASRQSQRESTTGDTVFEFDRTLATTLPYQRVPQLSYSGPETRSATSNGNHSRMTDEGYGSEVPTSVSRPRTGSLVIPSHPSGAFSPKIGHTNSATLSPTARIPTSNHTHRSKSDSFRSPLLDPGKGTKRGKLQSVFRRLSQASMKSVSSQHIPRRGLTDGSINTRRRQHDRDINTSIDLTSAEGAGTPLIVKTAQTSSWNDVERLIERGCDLEAKHLPTRRTALLVAAHCGNEAVVDTLIRKNARLDAIDKSGSTALHLAASRGHCRVLELLIFSQLIDLEARDSRGRTALFVAAERGEIEATHILLLSKAKVNARADTQMTALHIAAKQGDDATVKLLVNANADLEAKDGTLMTALHYASEKDHVNVMEILLDNKATIDVPGYDRRTPLICAAAAGGLLATALLLKRKASSRCVDDDGMTAMHWAAYNGHTEVVEILSSRKSSLTALNFAQQTTLHLSAMRSQFAVVELLLRKEVPIETKCQSGRTALHYTCLANSAELSRLLLMSGANIEAQMDDKTQRRPVHIAASQGSMGLLNLLCDKGANIEARDSFGYRALGVACREGHAAAVINLLDRNSPIHHPFDTWSREDSPLCLAAMGGHLPIVVLLLERGASVKKQDEQDWFPYQHAAYHGHPHVLEVLLSHTLANLTTEGMAPNLLFEGIGFAPAANISDERKMQVLDILYRAQHEPDSFVQNTALLASSSYTQDAPMRNLGAVMVNTSPTPAQHISPFATIQGATNRDGPAQELPGTLEQGLPSSRSQTPEQIHRPPLHEEQTSSGPASRRAAERNPNFHPRHDRPLSVSRAPQQPPPTIPRPPLSHPAPIRDRFVQPDGLLSGNGGFFGERSQRFAQTPMSIVEVSKTRSKAWSPFQAGGSRERSPDRIQRQGSALASDSESIASFSTASEGVGFFPGLAELPG